MKFIFVTGDKGGVGKSVIARLLADYFISIDHAVCFYDCDNRNPHLYNAYHDVAEVRRINLKISEKADGWVNHVIGEKKSILVDLPAAGNESVERMEAEFDFFEVFLESRIDLIFINVMNSSDDSVLVLKNLLKLVDGRAKIVAAKNLNYGSSDDFYIFDDSNVKKDFLEAGGKIIEIPALAAEVMRDIGLKSLPFFECVKIDSPLTLTGRRRVAKFRDKSFAAFESMRDLLISESPAVEEVS